MLRKKNRRYKETKYILEIIREAEKQRKKKRERGTESIRAREVMLMKSEKRGNIIEGGLECHALVIRKKVFSGRIPTQLV